MGVQLPFCTTVFLRLNYLNRFGYIFWAVSTELKLYSKVPIIHTHDMDDICFWDRGGFGAVWLGDAVGRFSLRSAFKTIFSLYMAVLFLDMLICRSFILYLAPSDQVRYFAEFSALGSFECSFKVSVTPYKF